MTSTSLFHSLVDRDDENTKNSRLNWTWGLELAETNISVHSGACSGCFIYISIARNMRVVHRNRKTYRGMK